MKTAVQSALLMIFLALFHQTLFAFDFQKYTQDLQSLDANTPAKSTLLAIMGSCGNLSNLDDNCVIDELSRVAIEEENTIAGTIVEKYESALSEGQFDTPECQCENHMQVNRIIGHCILLMNYYALESMDKDTAINNYETCIQGGMLGLASQSNVAAQFMVVEIFKEKGLPVPAKHWQKTLNSQKETEDYALLKKCYG